MFIVDCEVCCYPLEFSIVIENNELHSFSIQSIEQ